MTAVLQERDYTEAAFRLECEVEAVKSVCAVEAPRGGFYSSGHPVVLFEGHIFHKYTKNRFDASNPTLSYPRWTTAFYGDEVKRLTAAMALDHTAALMSASWGKFQIMGFNFALCGFTDVDSFVAAMTESEGNQLDAFVEYVIQSGLSDELQRRDWAGFARYYNGPEYTKNQYDVKLMKAYTHLRGAE